MSMIGQTISHYRILERLGEGGMGVVYKAQDVKLGRFVALKFLPPESIRDDQSKQRFVREAKAASALDHPNICTIHEIGETDEGQMFIVMPCYTGETLKEKIAKGTMNAGEAVDIVGQIATGLRKAHETGIVHRDIKPANIFVTHDGVVKIVDFGVAKLTGRTLLTTPGSTVGTIAYTSPEQVQGSPADQRSDLFALGIVMYEMLTGQRPFSGDHDAAILYSLVNVDPAKPSSLRSDITNDIDRVVLRLLEKAPEQRYQNAAEVREDLSRLVLGGPVAGSGLIGAVRGWGSGLVRKRASRISAIAAGILILLLTYLLTRQEAEGGMNIPIAVADFANQTGEKELDGLSGLLISSLEQSRRLTVLTRSRMYDILRQMGKGDVDVIDEALCQEISRRADIRSLVTASIRKFGRIYSVELKVLDRESDEYVLAALEKGEGQESIPGMIDDLAEKVRKNMSENPADLRTASIRVAEKVAQDFRAYEHYFRGEQFVNKLRFQEAQEEFKHAIGIDSTFGLAYYRLAYAIKASRSRFKEVGDVLDRAMQYIDRVPEKEQYLIRALYANLEASGVQLSPALDILKSMEKTYPEEKEMLLMIGDEYFGMGDYRNALTYYDKVLMIDSYLDRALEQRIFAYRSMAMPGQAIEAANRYVAATGSPRAYSKLVSIYEYLGKVKEQEDAVTNAENVFMKKDDRREFYSLLAEDLLERRSYPESMKMYKKALTLDPGTHDVSLLAGVGVCSEGLGQEEIARSYFEKGLVLDGTNYRCVKGLTEICLKRKDFRKAVFVAERFKQHSQSSLAYNYLSEVLERTNEIDKAAEVLREARSRAREHKHGFSTAIIRLYLEHNEPKKAEKEVETLLKHSSANNDLQKKVQILINIGFGYWYAEKYEEADSLFRQASALDSARTNVFLLNALAWSSLRLRKFTDARSYFEKALKIYPSHGGLLWGLYQTIMNQVSRAKGEEQERLLELALQHLQAWENIDPNDKVFYSSQRGMLYMGLRKDQLAEKELRNAVRLAPNDQWTNSGLANFLMDRDRFAEARPFAEKTYSLDTSFSGSVALARILIETGDVTRGLQIAEKARVSKPPIWKAYSFYYWPEVTLGLGYMRTGKFQKAVEFLEMSVKSVPDSTLTNDRYRQKMALLKEQLEEARAKLQRPPK